MNKKKTLLYSLIIYLLFFGVFLLIHTSIDGFIGTDPYYHAKHSQLVGESGQLTLIDPWVEFHFLSSDPADPYFLYHLIAAGFIGLFGITMGLKVLSAVLGAAIFPVFYILLKHFKIPRAPVWLFLLFISSTSFIFRLTLERAYVLSVALLPLAFYLIIKKKYVWLFLLSVFYILFYNLAPIIMPLAGLFILADIFDRRPVNLKPLIATAGGISVGLILHPQTQNYIHVIYIHFVKIITLKLQGIHLPSGAEIQLLPTSYFIKSNLIVVGCFLLAVGLFLAAKYYKKNKGAALVVLFAMSTFWFIVAFLVPRGTEYWIPFGWLFVALVFQNFYESTDFAYVRKFVDNNVNTGVLKFFLLAVFILVCISNASKFSETIYNHNQQNDLSYYQMANEFLIENTPRDSLVFYPNWSMFPKMFFFNTHNKYVAAFDPVFLYDYNPNIYWLWYHISINAEHCNEQSPCTTDWSPRANAYRIRSALKNIFGIDTIILKKGYSEKFHTLLIDHPSEFTQVYENDKLVIFEIK